MMPQERNNSLSPIAPPIYADKNIYICDDFRMLPMWESFTIGQIIRMLRERAGIKGSDIKKKLGVHKGTLSRIERTSKFDEVSLEKIAAGLKTSPAELYTIRDILRSGGKPAFIPDARSYIHPDHEKYHQMLEAILRDDGQRADWIVGNIVTFYAQMKSGRSPDVVAGLTNGIKKRGRATG